MSSLPIALFAVLSFLLGSIPFGLVIGRIFYNRDIRKAGSGNIGAMNALRTLGKGGAIAVLLLDALKGLLPPLLAVHAGLGLSVAAICALAAITGHCFSPWLRLRGGKGVATAFGALFAISWPSALAAIAGWLVGALSTTYSSAGSLLGNAITPVALWYFTRNWWVTGYGIVTALFIIYTHRENIARIAAGTESGIPFLRSKRP